MEDDPEPPAIAGRHYRTIQMLREVTMAIPLRDRGAAMGELSRSAVDRRIKGSQLQLTQAKVGVDGLQESGAAFVKRLRMHRDAIPRHWSTSTRRR